jgi:hypothetical protein
MKPEEQMEEVIEEEQKPEVIEKEQMQEVLKEETLLPFAWTRRGPRKYKIFPQTFLNHQEVSKDEFTIANLKEIARFQIYPGNQNAAGVIRALRRAASSGQADNWLVVRMVAADLVTHLQLCVVEGREPGAVTRQYEALLLLGVMSCGGMAHCGALIASGVLLNLIPLLDSSHAPKHVLFWTLGNIAAEGYACLLIKENVHLKLLEMVITTQDLPLLTAATYCLSHLCADLRTLDDKARVFGTLRLLLDQRHVLLEQRRLQNQDNSAVLKQGASYLLHSRLRHRYGGSEPESYFGSILR